MAPDLRFGENPPVQASAVDVPIPMTLLNPSALLFSVFLVGLVLLYLWERNQRRFDVPSMLLWQDVPESVVRRNRFQPDSLFWLQLAGLILLILGLANPYFESADSNRAAGRIILVVDLSASMQTIEDGVSRLELARDAAARIALASEPSAELMLIGAAREPKIISPFTRAHDEVLALAATLEASDVSANLEPVIAMAQRLAAQSTTPTEIHVFTDLPRESVGARWRDNINWWPFGSSDDNLAIVNLETTQGVLQSHRHVAARVTLRNFSAREKHGALTVTAGGDTVGHELFTAAPYSVETFHFPDITASGLLEVTLQCEDALTVDNDWRTWLPGLRPARIALIGVAPHLADEIIRIGAATDAIEVTVVSDATAAIDSAGADVAIYHRTTPAPLPDMPILLIAPSTDLATGQPLGQVDELEVLDWDENHDVLRGIEARLLQPFKKLTVLDPPPWSETVLATRAPSGPIPVLAVGQPNLHRVAILTADLAVESLLASDRETTLLLFLNTIDWLAGQPDEVAVVKTGESRPLDTAPGEITEIVAPRGQRIDVPSGPKPFLTFDQAGAYQLRRLNAPPSIILANFQDTAESDIARQPQSAHRVSAADRRDAALRPGRGLQNWFYLVAAAVLIGEWFAAARARDHG